ncbi:AAA family ATPase [Photobacterium toruni]|uniref:AAA family ATPase n=1 Tax=Photobacterium toruni TaxID=1935446 RepID=A0ABU6L306_9GAMM|nr:AAA family ATPase [Photobacterium toruni]
MEKILIIGNSGSGKSWLSARLSTLLNTKEINLDTIVWEPGGYNQKRSQESIDDELIQLDSESSWVVEGVFGALAEKMISSADSLIFLDIDWPVCKQSLLLRGSESSKQLDSELAEKNFKELLKWASEYNSRVSKSSHSYHSKLFDQFVGTKFRFLTREEVDSFVASVTC